MSDNTFDRASLIMFIILCLPFIGLASCVNSYFNGDELCGPPLLHGGRIVYKCTDIDLHDGGLVSNVEFRDYSTQVTFVNNKGKKRIKRFKGDSSWLKDHFHIGEWNDITYGSECNMIHSVKLVTH